MDKDYDSRRVPTIEMFPERGYFKISGRSYPQNAQETFHQLVLTIKEYIKTPCPETILDLDMELCNTSTIRVMVYIFETLEEMVKEKECKVAINWYIRGDNSDDLDLGYDMKKFTDLPFNIVKEDFRK